MSSVTISVAMCIRALSPSFSLSSFSMNYFLYMYINTSFFPVRSIFTNSCLCKGHACIFEGDSENVYNEWRRGEKSDARLKKDRHVSLSHCKLTDDSLSLCLFIFVLYPDCPACLTVSEFLPVRCLVSLA